MNNILKEKIATTYLSNYKKQPLIVFSPGRINLIGEHTDYNDGFVFPAAIDKGIITAIEKSETNYCSVYAYDKKEEYQFNLDSIAPLPNGGWQNYILGVVSEIQKKGIGLNPFNIVFGGDIPEGAGLSSSAALENSIVFALNELFQLGLLKEEMIFISQKAEHNFVGVKCGIMDQYASMFGVENNFLHLDCRTVKSKPYQIDLKNYELLLINTNVKHNLSESVYNNRRSVCENVSARLHKKALRDATEKELLTIKNKISEEDYQKALFVIQEIERTQLAAEALKKEDIKKLGLLIYQSHEGLQHQYKVSCDELDFLVEKAKESNIVIGSRMMGGGFGGCTINLIEKDKIDKFSSEITKSYYNKFKNKCSIYKVALSNGTHIVT
jgi:galactokinase